MGVFLISTCSTWLRCAGFWEEEEGCEPVQLDFGDGTRVCSCSGQRQGLAVTPPPALVFVKVPVACMSMLMSFQWSMNLCVCVGGGTLLTVIHSFVAWHLDSESG